MTNKPKLFMIGGPNGAGKTTTAFTLMPELVDCQEYVNADAIAASLSPFKADEMAIPSGKLMIQRIRALAQAQNNFAFEATMASRGFVPFLKACAAQGYEINLLFIWVSNVELAVQRVKSRVLSGGHDIPEDVIRRRYARSRDNFLNLYRPLADRWLVCDNSGLTPRTIATKNSTETHINTCETWEAFQVEINR